MKLSDKIGIRHVIVLILTACLGIRWIPVAGAIGPSAIVFWLFGSALFFVPLSVIVIELTHNFSADGGVYLWVKQSLGKRFAFYTAWLYWINNFFFYPGLLVFMVANLAYLIGDKHLAENHLFVITTVIISLWSAIFINISGIKQTAKIASFSCILNISLFIFIIGSGLIYIFTYHNSATQFNFQSFAPNENIWKNLSNLTLLMFALSGIELVPIMAGSVKNAKVILTKGIIYSGIIILLSYILGTFAINLILNPNELNNTTGLIEAFLAIANKLYVPWVGMLFIFLLFVVELGALLVWLIAPTVMLFECVEPGIIPAWMQKLNKHSVPANALIFIGCVVTLILILIQYLPTVNSIFTALVLMGTIVYFLPYLFLAVGYFKMKKLQQLKQPILKKSTGYICAILLFCSVSLGILLSLIPNSDIKTQHAFFIYEIELIAGPLLFSLLGFFIYSKKVKLQSR